MNQLLKNFIPLGDTGSVCYLQDTLKDFDSNEPSLIQTRIKELKAKKVQKLIVLRSLTKKVNYDLIIPLLESNGFQFSLYTPNSEFKKQIELFETVLDSNRQGNVCILFYGISPALFELTMKLVLYVNLNAPITDIYTYLTNESPDIITLNEFKDYVTFLENDPYLITKPDRAEFKKKANGIKSKLSDQESQANTDLSLNLNSLEKTISDDEPLLTETEAIHFNINSLIETDFEKEESPEEHYQRIKDTNRVEVSEGLSLDVDLSEEIEYISSLESKSDPTVEKVSIINIDTVPLDTPLKISSPTIDYKAKEFLDFDAIIEEEIEQGMLTDELSARLQSDSSTSFPESLDLDDILGEKENLFSFGKDFIQVEPPINLEDPIDPSQTFMVQRINDAIKKELLSEDSKGKIPVSDLTKINTKNSESVPNNTKPTIPKISNPKISSPKFNPITLDD